MGIIGDAFHKIAADKTLDDIRERVNQECHPVRTQTALRLLDEIIGQGRTKEKREQGIALVAQWLSDQEKGRE